MRWIERLLVLASQVPTGGHGEGLLVLLTDRKTHERTNPWGLPVVTVGELHVHAVATQEGLAVQGDVDVRRVLNRLTHYYKAGEKRLFIPAQSVRRASVIHFNLASAVQNLK